MPNEKVTVENTDENIKPDDTTQETGGQEVSAKAEENIASETGMSQEDIDKRLGYLLRKRDVEAATKLLKEHNKPEPVDMSKYVEKEKFDALFELFEKAQEQQEVKERETAKAAIVSQYGLTEADVELIDDDDVEKFEKRAAALAGRQSNMAKYKAVSTKVPDDLKNNELAQRLLRGG